MIFSRHRTYIICVILLAMVCMPFQVFSFSNDPYVRQDAYELIGVYDAWQYTTGSRDVIVAVIDNGFDHFHPDLVENVWNNDDEIPGNGIDDDTNGYIDDIVGWNFVPEDIDGDGEFSKEELLGNNNPRPTIDDTDTLVSGHGTAVAGLIGATGYNGLLGAGLNWRVSLMNLKVVGNTGNGTIQYVPEAIRYAVDNGADVISMSIVGFADAPEVIQQAVQYAYDNDVVVVAAAGNNLTDLNTFPLYPICSDAMSTTTESIIGVSAVSSGRTFARFSNYGSNCVDITAPGIGVSSTVRYSSSITGLTEQYRGELQGTSFATPLVSGTAALIRSLYPNLSAEHIIAAILTSTSKTPPRDEILYTNLFGAGLLQVSAALQKASEFADVSVIKTSASGASVTIPLSPAVMASYTHTDNSLTYYINNTPVRYLTSSERFAAVALHPSNNEIYILENSTPFGQTVSVYNQSGVGLRQQTYKNYMFDGIFMNGEAIYAYTLDERATRVYRLDSNGAAVLDVTIPVTNVTALTYNNERDMFVGVQYERILFSWSADTKVGMQTYIPLSLGPEIFRFDTSGSHIISFHENIATAWDTHIFRSEQIYLYTTKP